MRYLQSVPFFQEGLLPLLLKELEGSGAVAVLVLGYVLAILLAYLVGSVNTAILLSTKKYGYDIREYGSGNAGMTNMGRTFGAKAAGLTALGDIGKTVVALLVGMVLVGGEKGLYAAGFACLVGHSFPLFFQFKGGKGVIVSAVTILLIDPLVFLATIGIFLLMFAATRIVSASSITAAFFYPLLVYAFHNRQIHAIELTFSLFIGLFIIAMHRENIQRLIAREEKKVDFAKIRKKRAEKKKKEKRAEQAEDES